MAKHKDSTSKFEFKSPEKKPVKGMKINHFFSKEGINPLDQAEWKTSTAQITNEKGEVIFEQQDVEIPAQWSQLATNVVVSKYFGGAIDTPQRETSLRQVITRVADTISGWGTADGYFATPEDGDRFRMEMTSILLNQMAAFNSPVWFNVGVESHPQCSACFINSVEDKMESILELAKTEGMLFKFGSGAGSNLSPLRSSYEGMSGGGVASGPVSFMKGYDAFAGVIKSGGKTRRAAKMVILNIDHPDIEEFIDCKSKEEKKAHALIKQGYDPDLNGEAYSSIFFQNANHSVRVSSDFMLEVVQDGMWSTKAVTNGDPVKTYDARDLLNKISKSAWESGDPGVQFHSTINEWHTCPNTAPINASNPCSEYMFLDDSACNLASLNLLKFVREDGDFDIKAFRNAVRIILLAMEIIVDNASYPTKKIGKNSHDYRPLGLGYTNLGALLMYRGLPYDSDEGRAYAAIVTAIMHGEAYRTSAEIASHMQPFKGFTRNSKPFLRVANKHADALDGIEAKHVPEYMLEEARDIYEEMLTLGGEYGFRNAQVTVLAPTGTISFMMDADTTGIEPDLQLIKYKKLVGGGTLTLVNHTVPDALRVLGYDDDQSKRIVEYIHEHHTIEGAPGLKDEHLPVFDCALKPNKGVRMIHYMGHVRMMQVVQPFLSGAISKTVNMPSNISVEDVYHTYLAAWQMGLKSIAIYRDGCKINQPLLTAIKEAREESKDDSIHRPRRIKLLDERKSVTHKFSVGGNEGYITVGMYENGQPGELFIVMSKQGSVVSGLMDSFATAISIALQYGVPLKVLVRKFMHTRFEPSGYTNNEDIPIAYSVMDYIFRWLALKFLPPEEHGMNGNSTEDTDEDKEADSAKPPGQANHKPIPGQAGSGNDENGGKHAENGEKVIEEAKRIANVGSQMAFAIADQTDAPPCPNCGMIMVRNGMCFVCQHCGTNTGCG